MKKYRAERDGSEWSGCDGRPNLDDLTDEELDTAIVTIREMVSKEANGELPSQT